MASRALHLTFYILYLITLSIGLWFLLYYSGVPSWVWIFFGVAMLISIINAIMKELLLVTTITTNGRDVTDSSYTFWLVLYIIMDLIALILIIIGIVLVIRYSTLPWWVWVVLGTAIFFSIMSGILLAFSPGSALFAIILSVIGFIFFIAGIILLITYSQAPWWVWLIFGVAVLFAMLASLFGGMTNTNQVIIQETCLPNPNCPVRTITVTPVAPVTIARAPVKISLLPSEDIPEQIIT